MLVDPDEANDWTAEFDVDLARSRVEGVPVMHICVWLGPLTGERGIRGLNLFAACRLSKCAP